MANSPFEVPNEMRDFAERSVEQARKAFEGFLTVAQRATGAAGELSKAPEGGAKSVSAHVLSYTERNVNAAFDLAQKLVKAKDPQEALALQSEYLKTQLAVLQEQAKEFGSGPAKEHHARFKLRSGVPPPPGVRSQSSTSTSRLFMANARKKSPALKRSSVLKSVSALAPVEVEARPVSAAAPLKAELSVASAAEIQQSVRSALEKGVVESRAVFTKAKIATDETLSAFEVSFAAAKDSALAIHAKAFEALRANADAGFDFLKAVSAVKSLPDLATLQTEFARKQFETIASQTKDFSALAQKAMADAVEPIKGQVAKSFRVAV